MEPVPQHASQLYSSKRRLLVHWSEIENAGSIFSHGILPPRIVEKLGLGNTGGRFGGFSDANRRFVSVLDTRRGQSKQERDRIVIGNGLDLFGRQADEFRIFFRPPKGYALKKDVWAPSSMGRLKYCSSLARPIRPREILAIMLNEGAKKKLLLPEGTNPKTSLHVTRSKMLEQYENPHEITVADYLIAEAKRHKIPVYNADGSLAWRPPKTI